MSKKQTKKYRNPKKWIIKIIALLMAIFMLFAVAATLIFYLK